MISILIPVFNTYVQSLVQELSLQLDTSQQPGEILVYDDFSDESFKSKNQTITSFKNVIYKQLEKNVGRIEVRKFLAAQSQYDWLLFIDADSLIPDRNFLNNYIEAINERHDVYTGGRIYQNSPPAACNKRLHWKYGIEREALKASATTLHTNNFCIKKDVFLALDFPSELKGYGHEDTWMQLQLETEKKEVCFIHNPVVHLGLEDALIFLEKAKNALKNLVILAGIVNEQSIRKHVSLYNLFFWLRKFGLINLIESNVERRINKITVNLQSCNPSLFQFDLYRLYYLIKFAKAQLAEKLIDKTQ